MKNGIKIDARGFKKNIAQLQKEIPGAIEKAVGTAGMQVLADATLELPTTPIDEGTLRGSGSVHVENKLFGVSPKVNGLGEPLTGPTGLLLNNKAVTAYIGFNRPYAKFVHEGIHPNGRPIRYSNVGSGAKYLERKLASNSDLYIKIVGVTLKRILKT